MRSTDFAAPRYTGDGKVLLSAISIVSVLGVTALMMGAIRHLLGYMIGRKILPRHTAVGSGTYVSPDAYLDMTADGALITLGSQVTISSRVTVLCHDASSNRRLRATWVSPVVIEDRAFIGAGSIILPGVRVGADAIVGAGSVVTHDVPSSTVFAGNPARQIGTLDDLESARRERMQRLQTFDIAEFMKGKVDSRLRSAVIEAANRDGGAFLVGSAISDDDTD